MTNKIIPESLRDLFSFKGTITRLPYVGRQIVGALLLVITMFVLATLSMQAFEKRDGQGTGVGIIIGMFVMITIIVAILAQITKRVRDIGWPIWTVPAFLLGATGLSIIAADNELRLLLIVTNVVSTVAGIALVFAPSKALEFPEAIYARTPDSITSIDAMIDDVPDEGGNSFFTFIFGDNTKGEFTPDNIPQMKLGWLSVREAMDKGDSAIITILRRDASKTIRNGENITDDRMWIVNNENVWELTPEELQAAMA